MSTTPELNPGRRCPAGGGDRRGAARRRFRAFRGSGVLFLASGDVSGRLEGIGLHRLRQHRAGGIPGERIALGPCSSSSGITSVLSGDPARPRGRLPRWATGRSPSPPRSVRPGGEADLRLLAAQRAIVGARSPRPYSADLSAVLRNSTLLQADGRARSRASRDKRPCLAALAMVHEWLQLAGLRGRRDARPSALKLAVWIVVGLAAGAGGTWVMARNRAALDASTRWRRWRNRRPSLRARSLSAAPACWPSPYPDRAALASAACRPSVFVVTSTRGIGCFSHISLFLLSGLLVFPGQLRRVCSEGAGRFSAVADLRRPAAGDLPGDRATRSMPREA